MARIGWHNIRRGQDNAVIRVGIYSTDDANVAWKGLRVRTGNGTVGCLNAVTDGTHNTGLSIRDGVGTLRRIKTYTYSTYQDNTYTQNWPGSTWSAGTERIYYGGGYWTDGAVKNMNTSHPRTTYVKGYVNFDAGSSTSILNRTWYLWVWDGAWYNTYLSVYPTAFTTDYYTEGGVSEGTYSKHSWCPTGSSNTNWNWYHDITMWQYKVNELVYI